jgi:transposase
MVPTYFDRWTPMQPSPAARRVHSAEFKAKVLAACEEPGASIAGVAVAHGLNPNLVRKWLIGRGLKRAGLPTPRPSRKAVGVVPNADPQSAPMTFVPVAVQAPSAAAVRSSETIEIELHRAGTDLAVRWPASEAEHCAAWLRELLGALPADAPARASS